jgi:hypothetical protein
MSPSAWCLPLCSYAVLGDVVQRGYDAPKMAMVYMDDPTRQFAQPEGYDLVSNLPRLGR